MCEQKGSPPAAESALSRKQRKADAALAEPHPPGMTPVVASGRVSHIKISEKSERDAANHRLYNGRLSLLPPGQEFVAQKEHRFHQIALDGDPRARRDMTARAHGRMSVPQIFFDDIHIGDCDELHELDRDGKLDNLLAGGVQ
jgi:glutaredoxin 3